MGAAGSIVADGSKKVILVTGCSEGGIGHELAKAFAKKGCRVIASARSLPSIQSLRDHPMIDCLTLDVTLDSSIKEAIEIILKKYGRLDILVNNAGMPCVAPVAELPMDLLERTFQTNVFGAVRLIQAIIPHMISQGSGRIVNVGSLSTYAPGPWAGGYTASKCALHSLTDSLRLELKPFNIDVTLVVPGAIATHFGENALKIASLSTLKLYKHFKRSILARAAASQGPRSTTAHMFAQKTVDAILKRNPPPHFVYGHLTFILSVLYHAPVWFRDLFYVRYAKFMEKDDDYKSE